MVLFDLVGSRRLPSFRSIAKYLVELGWYQCSHRRSTDSQRWWVQGYYARSLANLSPVRHALLRVEFFISYQGQRLHSCFPTIALRIGYRGGSLHGFYGHGYRAQEGA